jgi:hypothetical protein
MTTLVVRGLFNAVAFAGAGFLFSILNNAAYKEEIKRHNQALAQNSQKQRTNSMRRR